MKQLAPGIIVLDNGLHYFSAERVRAAVEALAPSKEVAIVTRLINEALTAEFKAYHSEVPS